MKTSPCRLLLVDDDPHQLKLMKLTLEGHGYTVHTAQDGQEALDMLPLNPPDGVISDVFMPRLDGFQLCCALRKDDRFSHLPVVLLSSAYTEPDDLHLANEVGANALVARTPNVQYLARQAVEGLKMARHALACEQKMDDPGAEKRLRQMEEQLRHSQKLESIGQVAVGIAHELNNPLGAILGFTQSLLSHPDAPDITHVLRTMETEARRCSTLVKEMLSFARKPSEETAMESLPTLADGVLGMINARAKTDRVTIERHYEDNVPSIRVNGNQIQQVLVNLFTNALDAMPKGGTLSLTIARVGNEVVLRVTDTGEGIAPEHLGQIFEAFFTTKATGKGTGLGLSLAQDIVAKHRGRVEVQSEPGHGTTFQVYLPFGGAL